MNKIVITLIAISSLLSGCVAYEVQDRDQGMHRGDREHGDYEHDRGHDRDGDGVPNRQDNQPNDPHRY